VAKFKVPAFVWYGQQDIELEFPEDWPISFLPMKGYYARPVDPEEIQNALRRPIGTKPLAKLAEGKKEAVIVIDDMSRPTRAYEIIPHVLDEFKRGGIADDHIHFIMGGGMHGAWYRDDFVKKIGESITSKYPVYNHNPFGNCEKIGTTSRGTPLEINSDYLSCDLRVGIGAVVPHPIGYGGGAKIILPGIASYNTVYYNHVTLLKQNPSTSSVNSSKYWGSVKGDVRRQDINEAGRIVGIEMKIDVFVNGKGETSRVFAGDVIDEFIAAASQGREQYSTPGVPDDIDVLVANTYGKVNEAQLALMNWGPILKKEAVMVIIAHAPEGQVTHYLLGRFGRNELGPGIKLSEINFKKLIMFSEYSTPDPLLPLTTSEVTWNSNWNDVVDQIRSLFDHAPRVVILPNADTQCDEQIFIDSNKE
jgi:nickel-dependent lactate racemase